ncbi:MAG: hypothetical protein ACRDPT_17560 [Streptomycetales bacterium]
MELYDRSPAAVSVSGWSVQYASAADAGGGTQLPAPDATGTTNMSATSGKVALVTSTTELTCGGDCDTAAGVRDFLGYGSASDFEGAPAPALSNTTSATRTDPAVDTDDNSADFARVGPSPQSSAGGGRL